jgi:divalent metal cation (Fe/Co/Zn/Cd) transporter
MRKVLESRWLQAILAVVAMIGLGVATGNPAAGVAVAIAILWPGWISSRTDHSCG